MIISKKPYSPPASNRNKNNPGFKQLNSPQAIEAWEKLMEYQAKKQTISQWCTLYLNRKVPESVVRNLAEHAREEKSVFANFLEERLNLSFPKQ